jgi:hypothetical protein
MPPQSRPAVLVRTSECMSESAPPAALKMPAPSRVAVQSWTVAFTRFNVPAL